MVLQGGPSLRGWGGRGTGTKDICAPVLQGTRVFLEEGSNQPMPASHCSEDARLRQDASSLCLSLCEQTESEKCTSAPELSGTVQRTQNGHPCMVNTASSLAT